MFLFSHKLVKFVYRNRLFMIKTCFSSWEAGKKINKNKTFLFRPTMDLCISLSDKDEGQTGLQSSHAFINSIIHCIALSPLIDLHMT